MTNIVKVARLHLVDRFCYTWLVWGVLAFTFVVNLAIFAVIPVDQTPQGITPAALLSIYLFMVLIGVQAATKFLPFAFTLGVSRRTYYLGTVGLVIGLCAAVFRRTHAALVARSADQWLGTAIALLPGALDSRRPLVSGADHQLRAAESGVPGRAVVRADLPPVWADRLGGLHAGLLADRGGERHADHYLAAVRGRMSGVPGQPGFLAASGLVVMVGVVVAVGGYLTIRRITV